MQTIFHITVFLVSFVIGGLITGDTSPLEATNPVGTQGAELIQEEEISGRDQVEDTSYPEVVGFSNYGGVGVYFMGF